MPQVVHKRLFQAILNLLYIDGLVQDCSNSIANALELLQSCTKPSILFIFAMLMCLQAISLLKAEGCHGVGFGLADNL